MCSGELVLAVDTAWVCEIIEALGERVLNVENLLTNLDVRIPDGTGRLWGSNWEVSEEHIAVWAAGSSLTLTDVDTYARLKDGSLEIRGGNFSIHTGEADAHMTFDGTELLGYNAGGVLTIKMDWAAGQLWAKKGGFGGTYAAPLIVLNENGTATIAGWDINAASLSKNNAVLSSAGTLVLGTADDVVFLSAVDATWRLWIGNNIAADAPFRITKAGVLTAAGASITGTFTVAGVLVIDADGITVENNIYAPRWKNAAGNIGARIRLIAEDVLVISHDTPSGDYPGDICLKTATGRASKVYFQVGIPGGTSVYAQIVSSSAVDSFRLQRVTAATKDGAGNIWEGYNSDSVLQATITDAGMLTVAGPVLGLITVNTQATILALTPGSNQFAYATDTDELYLYDGSNWRAAPLEFNVEVETPDMGAYNAGGLTSPSDRSGYYKEDITDKNLHNITVRGSVRTDVGGLRINVAQDPNTFEIYLRDAWQTLIYDLTTEYGDFRHTPLSQEIYVWRGDSVLLGLNGRPTVQEYGASMGAYPPAKVLNGGLF